jgi:hypothetical protein
MGRAINATKIILGLGLMTVGVPKPVCAIELQADTLKAWNDYIRSADSRMEARSESQRPFLWTDEVADRARRLRRGEILVAPVIGHGAQTVPNGLIHDWIGAAFIPNATLDGLFAVVHDYDRYQEIYRPVVAASKTVACTDTDQQFSMVWQQRILWVHAAIEGQYKAHDFLVSGHRGYNIAATTQVQEIEHFGQSDEHLLPPGQGNGFMWRIHSIARYEERDGGVYLELEAIALTRDIPASLRWLVNPVVNHLSVNSLMTTLRQTREAIVCLRVPPERLTSCAARLRGSEGRRLERIPEGSSARGPREG